MEWQSLAKVALDDLVPISIQMPLKPASHDENLADKAASQIGRALVLMRLLTLWQAQRATGLSSALATRETAVRTWLDYSKMVIELLNIAVQLKILRNSLEHSPLICVSNLEIETCEVYGDVIRDFAINWRNWARGAEWQDLRKLSQG